MQDDRLDQFDNGFDSTATGTRTRAGRIPALHRRISQPGSPRAGTPPGSPPRTHGE